MSSRGFQNFSSLNTPLKMRPGKGARHLKRLIAFAAIGAVSAGLLLGFKSNTASMVTAQAETVKIVPLSLNAAHMAEHLSHIAFVSTKPETKAARGELKSRETMTGMLQRLGANRAEANEIVYAIQRSEALDLRRLRPGLDTALFFTETGLSNNTATEETESNRLEGANFRLNAEKQLILKRKADETFSAHILPAKIEKNYARITGEISSSLYLAAQEAGAFDQQIVDFASIFAYDIDFQREIRPGDKFEFVYETFTDERGKQMRTGKMLFAALDGHVLTKQFYRFTPEDDGITDHFDSDGKAARKFLMRTPVNGARLSSHFGKRRHPISGYTRMHKGTDFAARTGTPIMAAGHGIIERASRYGGYGKYVRIKHAKGYQTAYAHMSRYGKGIKKGKRVRQGQIIGYVGSTGKSTGPHLHYEVLKNGKHVNAMRLKLPTGRTLEGEVLEAFELKKAEIDALRLMPALNELEIASSDISSAG